MLPGRGTKAHRDARANEDEGTCMWSAGRPGPRVAAGEVRQAGHGVSATLLMLTTTMLFAYNTMELFLLHYDYNTMELVL